LSAPATKPDERAPQSTARRVVWFVAIYVLSLGSFTAVVYALRAAARY
jgi:hypothetical protein